MPTVLRVKTPADLLAESAAEKVVRLELWKGDLQTVFGRFQLCRIESPDGAAVYQLRAVDTQGARFLHGTGDVFHPDERIEADSDTRATAAALTLLWNRAVTAMRDFGELCEAHGCEPVAWPAGDDTAEYAAPAAG